jgi:hypothetical protein
MNFEVFMSWKNIGRDGWNEAIVRVLRSNQKEPLQFIDVSHSFLYSIARSVCILNIEQLQYTAGDPAQQALNEYIQNIQESAQQEFERLASTDVADWVNLFKKLNLQVVSPDPKTVESIKVMMRSLNTTGVFADELINNLWETLIEPVHTLYQKCIGDFLATTGTQDWKIFLGSWKDVCILSDLLPIEQDTFAFDCSYERLGRLLAAKLKMPINLNDSSKVYFVQCVWHYFIQSFELERITFKLILQANAGAMFPFTVYDHTDLDDYALVRTKLMGVYGKFAVPPVSYLFFFCSVIAKSGSELFVVQTQKKHQPSERYTHKIHALLTQHGCYARQKPDKVGQIVLGFDEMSRGDSYSGGPFVLFPRVRDVLMGNGQHEMVIGALHAVSFPSKKDEKALKDARSKVGLELWDNNNLLTHQTLLEDRLSRALKSLSTTKAFGWFFKQPDFFSIPSVQRILMSDWDDVGVEVQQDEIVRIYIRIFRLSATSPWTYSVFISTPLYQEIMHLSLSGTLCLFADEEEVRNIEGFTAYRLQALIEGENVPFTGLRIVRELLLDSGFDFCLPRRFRDSKRVPVRQVRENEYLFAVQEAKQATHSFDFGAEEVSAIVREQEALNENELLGHELIVKDGVLFRNHILAYPFARPQFELLNNKQPISTDDYQMFFEYQITEGIESIVSVDVDGWKMIVTAFKRHGIADCRVYVVSRTPHLQELKPGQRDSYVRNEDNIILVEDIRLKKDVAQVLIQNPSAVSQKYFADGSLSEELRLARVSSNRRVQPMMALEGGDVHGVNTSWQWNGVSGQEVKLDKDTITLFTAIENIIVVYLENRKKHQMPMVGKNPWKTMLSITRAAVVKLDVHAYTVMTYLVKAWADQGRIIPRQRVTSHYPKQRLGQRRWEAPEDVYFVEPYLTRYRKKDGKGDLYVLTGFTNSEFRKSFMEKLQDPALAPYISLKGQAGSSNLRVTTLIRFKLRDEGIEVLTALLRDNGGVNAFKKQNNAGRLPLVDALSIDLEYVSRMAKGMRNQALNAISSWRPTSELYKIRIEHNVAPYYWIRLSNSNLEFPYLCTRDKEDFILVLSALYPDKVSEFLIQNGQTDVRYTGLHPLFAMKATHLSGAAPEFWCQNNHGYIRYSMDSTLQQQLQTDIQSVHQTIGSVCSQMIC